MSRLSDEEYDDRHLFLKQAWDQEVLYSSLSATDQWAIHAYYQPGKDMSREELLEHRRHITAERPGLAATAGKAYKAMYERYRRQVAAAQAAGSTKTSSSPTSQSSPR